MREIKFRAWDGEKMHVPVFLADDFLTTETTYVPHSDWEDAKRFIVMQFTGLKDKNGEEIYEGDIVKLPNGLILKIGWEIGFHQYCGKSRATSAGFNFMYKHDEVEIIGNIYENPELLK